ncbi:cobalt ion binding [Abeliophyllum distichum]|uniref:Cobalt ion binding n=1 Tax=Abeliophyllum distichum TaxID=126358 RepID=A0ABD1S9Z9_9LAMI
MAATNYMRSSFLSKLKTSCKNHNRPFSAKTTSSSVHTNNNNYTYGNEGDEQVPTSGISRPLSEILKELNKKVPDSLIRVRTEPDGASVKYIPWHIVNRIMNLHAPEWSGEVRSITYSADGKSVSVVYRVTLYGTDAEIYRESTGTASTSEPGYGDPVQKAEAMAFRRACARLGLGLHLYHEDVQ